MFGLAKKSSINKEDIPHLVGLTAMAIPTGLMMAKSIQEVITSLESQKDIRAPLDSLNNRKDKMQAVRTAFQDEFKHFDIPGVDNTKTKLTVGRSMLPWKDRYDAHILLYDKKGVPISDLTSYDAQVYRDEDKKYTGYVDMIFTRDNMKRKGIGRTVENKMVDAFRDLGISKSKLMPAFDGPLVWAKKDFGYQISPKDKGMFLKAYEKWCKKNDVSFEDLGDIPGNYPENFLKEGIVQYPWKSLHYEKPIDKAADEIITGLAKLAASFDAQRSKQYWQMLKRLYGGTEEAVNAIRESGDSGIWHGTHDNNIPSILQRGLEPIEHPHGQLYGNGQYFGEKQVAERYPRSGGSLLRLKRPSELLGTKELYPNVQKVMKIDNADEMATIESKKALFANARDRIIEQSGPEAHDLWWTTKSRFKPGNKEKYHELSRKIKDEDNRMRQSYPLLDKENPTSEANKLRYFGKTNTDEIALDPIHRNSFLIQQKNISPSILKRSE
jgi:GNAT superfamily N-acetyltransferase